jgi:hypothetical protein
MAGQLDPAIVSVPDLKRGLQRLERQARKVGMRVAPMENQVEVLFSAPVTTLFEDGLIHVWISVPLIPEEAPVFELLHLSHQPVPMGDFLVELDASGSYLAVDHLRRMHASVTATELAACEQHRRNYFCRRQTFSLKSDSCAIALLRGERATAAELCRKYVFRAPMVAATLDNASPRLTLVAAAVPTSVQRLCPHGSSQPVLRVSNLTKVVVPAGCYLQAGDEVTFLSHAPPEVVVASDGEDWSPEDIFGEELLSVHERLHRFNITREKMLLPAAVPEVTAAPVWLWPMLAALTTLLLLILVDLAARYYCLAKARLQSRSEEER